MKRNSIALLVAGVLAAPLGFGLVHAQDDTVTIQSAGQKAGQKAGQSAGPKAGQKAEQSAGRKAGQKSS